MIPIKLKAALPSSPRLGRWPWFALGSLLVISCRASPDPHELLERQHRTELAVRAAVLPHLREPGTGAVVALVVGDQSYLFGFGRRSDTDSHPPDGQTVFELGSVTKIFTSLLLADMVEHGHVSYDLPLQKVLPADAEVPFMGQPITLFHLAVHTSGLPQAPWLLSTARTGRVYDFLRHVRLGSEPGEEYGYSGLGEGMLGLALAMEESESFDQLLENRVLRPFGMNQSGMAEDPLPPETALAQGHDASGAPARSEPGFSVLEACCGMRTTGNDLLTFLQAELQPKDHPLEGPIAASHVFRHRIDGRMGETLGWELDLQGGRLSDFGRTSGFNSGLVLDPKHRIGLAILSNSAGFQAEEVASELLQQSGISG